MQIANMPIKFLFIITSFHSSSVQNSTKVESKLLHLSFASLIVIWFLSWYNMLLPTLVKRSNGKILLSQNFWVKLGVHFNIGFPYLSGTQLLLCHLCRNDHLGLSCKNGHSLHFP